MYTETEGFVRAAHLDDVRKAGRLVVALRINFPSGVNAKHTVLLIHENDKIYAVDNRCPHMGFPLHRGTVKDCMLARTNLSDRLQTPSGCSPV